MGDRPPAPLFFREPSIRRSPHKFTHLTSETDRSRGAESVFDIERPPRGLQRPQKSIFSACGGLLTPSPLLLLPRIDNLPPPHQIHHTGRTSLARYHHQQTTPPPTHPQKSHNQCAKIRKMGWARIIFFRQDYFFLEVPAPVGHHPLAPQSPKGLQKNRTPRGGRILRLLKKIILGPPC